MKDIKKRLSTILSVLLSLVLVLNLGVGVSADENIQAMDQIAAGEMVATVTTSDGNTIGNYENLQSAVDAAMNVEGSTVTILSNITLETGLNITDGNFCIDLAGKKIDCGDESTITMNGGNIVLQNSSSEGGMVENTSSEIFGSGIELNGGQVTIEGGTYLARYGIIVNGGELIVHDGFFNGYSYPIANYGGTVVIEGGTLNGSGGWAAFCVGSNSVNTTIIRNGAFIPAVSEGNEIVIDYRGSSLDLSQCQVLTSLKFTNRGAITTEVTKIILPEEYVLVAPNGEIVTQSLQSNNLGGRTVSVGLKSEVAEYTVYFDANGGSGTMAPVEHILRDYTLPECSFDPPEGKAFQSWNVNGKEYAPGTEIAVKEDTTVFATWYNIAATVTAEDGSLVGYYDNIESAIAAASQNDNSTLKLMTDMECDNVYLNGGTYTIDLNGKNIIYKTTCFRIENDSNITFEDTSGGNGTVTNNNGYKVRFAFQVSGTSKLTIKGGTYIGGQAAICSYSNVVIEGGNFSVTKDNQSVILNYGDGSTTINQGFFNGKNAYYAISNTGSLYLNGGNIINGKSGTIEYYGGKIDLSQNSDPVGIVVNNRSGSAIIVSSVILLPEGYYLVDKNNIQVEEIVESGEKVTVSSSRYFKITFEPNGGSGQMGAKAVEAGEYTLPECDFNAPEGTVFKSWEIDGVEEYQPGEKYTITKNTTVTAVWENLSYTVNFYQDESQEAESKTITVPYGDYTLPECSFDVPEGKVFKAWKIDGKEYAAGEVYKITDSKEIVAVWESLSYTVRFLAGGGSGTMENETVPYGDYILPECGFTAPEGQMFKAWLINNQEYAAGEVYKITGDTLIMPVWKTRTFTVSFDAGGGSGQMNDVNDIISYYTFPACMFTAPDGMQFRAWKIGEEEQAPGYRLRLTDDIKLTAVWEEIPQNPVASVTPPKGATILFEDLQEAFDYAMNEANTGSTVRLLSDIELSKSITINGGWSRYEATLDFNGYNLILSNGTQLSFENYANVLLENSSEKSGGMKGSGNRLIYVRQSSITINGGRYEGTNTNSIIECASSGEVMINDGTFVSEGGFLSKVVYLSGDGLATINGGEFNCTYAFSIESANANLDIKGGVYNVVGSEVLYGKGTVNFTDHPEPTGIQIQSNIGEDTAGSKIQLPEGYVMLDSTNMEKVDILKGLSNVTIGAEPTIHVDISWGEMAFTYEEGEWNPKTHSYDIEGGWKKAEKENAGEIQVTNRSSTSMKIQYKFEKDSGTDGIDNVTGSFDSKSETFHKNTGTSVLASEGGAEIVDFSLDGKPSSTIEPNTVLGTVTVVIGEGKEN